MDEIKMIVAIFLFAGVLIFLISIGSSSLVEYLHCGATGKALNYKTEWHFWTGCIVEKSDGSRVLLEQMRDMEK